MKSRRNELSKLIQKSVSENQKSLGRIKNRYKSNLSSNVRAVDLTCALTS